MRRPSASRTRSPQAEPDAAPYIGMEMPCMNTLIAIIAQTSTALAYWQRPLTAWFKQFEQTASRFIENNELDRLNHTPHGESFHATELLFTLAEDAWRYAQHTDYYFQPFIANQMRSLGYDRSFEQLEPSSIPKAQALTAEAYQPTDNPEALRFNKDNRSIQKNTSLQLDFGGIGKGWGADRAQRILQNEFQITAGLIDTGGDIAVWSSDEPWCIGVQNPFQEQQEVMQLWLKEGCLATSNRMYRRWRQDGVWKHHLLNGHSGTPVDSDLIQVTAICHKAAEAEVAAKMLFMLEESERENWMQQHFPEAAVICIYQDGAVGMNKQIYDYAVKVV